MKVYLIVSKGKHTGYPVPIDIDLFMMGAAAQCQLRASHPEIGHQHCMVVTRGKKVFIRDLNSGQATLVNDDVLPPSEEWPLHLGDRIRIGPLEFMIQFHERPLSQRDLEEWALRCLDQLDVRKRTALEELDDIQKTKVAINNASEAANSILQQLTAARGVVRGRLRIARESGMTIVKIHDPNLTDEAELNLLNKELHDNLSVPNLHVLLDFKNVRKLSTHAADMFAKFVVWLKPFGSTLAMCRLRPELHTAFRAIPILRSIPIYLEKQSALEARW